MQHQQLRQGVQDEEPSRATLCTVAWNRDPLEFTATHHEDPLGFLSSDHRHDEAFAQALSERDQVEEGGAPAVVCDQLDNG
jgi:hypothetical protein